MIEPLLEQPRRRRGDPDQEASLLYAEYGDKIFRYCLGRLRSREEAEDATQNTFLRVCTALRKGTVPELEGPWLYKIAHNVCLSRCLGSSRRARVETPADLDTLGDRAAAHTPDADELFGLGDALADMPSNLRRPLLMREWQGMSYMEIADALGVSHSAVETLIFRARRHLAQALVDPVKKTGRAVASIFNIRWLYGLLKGLGGGAGSAGLVAGAAGIVVAIGGGVAIDLAVQRASASHSSASSTQVAQSVAAKRTQAGTAGARGARAENALSVAAAAGPGGAAQVTGRAGAGSSATATDAQSPAAASVGAVGASSAATGAAAAAASPSGRQSTASSTSTPNGANGTGSVGGSKASPPGSGSSKAPPPPVAPPKVPDPGSLLPPPPSIDPPTVDPPSIDPPAIDPPAIDPPAIDPPAIDPPAIDPPAIDPPAIDPPAIDPPAIDPPPLPPLPPLGSVGAPADGAVP